MFGKKNAQIEKDKTILDQKSDYILDKEITKIEEDKFGHSHYSEVLVNLIEGQNKSYSIGLLGDWGTGKSSIKKMCQEILRQKSDIYYVDFNAWKYGGEDIKRALLKHAFKSLGGNEKIIYDKLNCQISKGFKFEETPEQIKFKIEESIMMLGQIIVICVLIALSLFLASQTNWFLKYFLSSVPNIAILALVFEIIKKMLGNNNFVVSFFGDGTKVELPKTKAEDYEEELVNQFKNFQAEKDFPEDFKDNINKNFSNLDISKCTKIVFFIDDLDRLEPKDMIAGLDAIKIFMEMQPEDINVVFVVSCCEKKIAKALQFLELKTYNENLDGIYLLKAREYLDKIFQLKIDIAPLPEQNLQDFAREKFHNLTKDYEKIIQEQTKNKYNLNSLIDRLIPFSVKTPRRVIQLINAFCSSLEIAQKREEYCSECNVSKNEKCKNNKTQKCLLTKGVITNNPVFLAIITVFKVNFPDFYQELLKEPNLLKGVLIQAFDANFEEINLTQNLEKIVSNYSSLEKNEDLHLYLSSIQDFSDFPISIKPFLQLMQDDTTRAIGSSDDVILIQNAILSGYLSQTETLLGKTITETQTDMLKDIRNNIANPNIPKEQKDRADKVLISLSNKFLGNSAKELINALAKRISDSDAQFSINVGIENITNLLQTESIDMSVQNSLLRTIIDYYYDDQYTFSEKEKSKTYFIKILDCLGNLKYVKKCLNKDFEEDIPTFFVTRTFSYIEKNKETEKEQRKDILFKFEILQEWIKTYGDELLFDINFQYLEELIDKINKDTDGKIDLELAKEHISKILLNFLNIKKSEIQKTLLSCLSSNKEDLVSFTIGFISDNQILSNSSIENLSEILTALSKRIISSFETPDEFGIKEWEDICLTLVNFINDNIDKLAKAEALNDELLTNLCKLTKLYRNEESDLSIDLLNILYRLNKELAETEILAWCQDISVGGELIYKLPVLLNKIQSEKCDAEIVKQLSLLMANISTPLQQAQIKYYENFMTSILENYQKSIMLSQYVKQLDINIKAHIEIIKSRLSQYKANPSIMTYKTNYETSRIQLSSFIESFSVGIFKIITNFDDIYKMIDNLFLFDYLNTNTEISKFNKLFDLMSNNWPKKIQNYKADDIVIKSLDFIITNDSEHNSRILESIYTLHKIIPSASMNYKILKSKLLDAAIKEWKNDNSISKIIISENINSIGKDRILELSLETDFSRQEQRLNLESVINDVFKDERNKIADYLHEILTNNKYSSLLSVYLEVIKRIDAKSKNLIQQIENILIEKTATSGDIILTANNKKIINENITSHTDFAKKLLKLFPEITAKGKKQKITQWIKDLDQSVITEGAIANLALEDLIILKEKFTADRQKKNIEKLIRKKKRN